ncbi:MAG: hypothetical protein HWE30_00380 [Methylocystaceae bacterium]|nr:hypothetical protein [Methylocystaceae bacterium]
MSEISAYSATAASYDYAQARRDMFSNADSDGDSKLSIEEFIAAKPADAPEGGPDSSEIFASLDTDEDGFLTESEMEAGGPPPGPPPGPPRSGDSEDLLSTDMLSLLLQAIEENLSTSETDETESATATEETDESNTSDIEDDILSLIQEELENYRNSSSPYAQAAQAYGQYQAQALAGQTLAQG